MFDDDSCIYIFLIVVFGQTEILHFYKILDQMINLNMKKNNGYTLHTL